MRLASDRARINLLWLVKLRWASSAGRLLLLVGVRWGLGIDLPLTPLAALLALEVATNAACSLWLRSGRGVSEGALGGLMALDVAILTGLLYLTGGPFNPFSFFYLVQIALAAVVLPARWTWALLGLSLLGSGLLFLDHRPLELVDRSHDAHMAFHLRGMWLAYGVTGALIVWFLRRTTAALAAREEELRAARDFAARQERLATLATLAAGAAHELRTPLSTIVLVARELERHLERSAAPGETLEDVRLIRTEVERCRAILDRMASDAGESGGEAFQPVGIPALVEAALEGLPPEPRIRVDLGEGLEAEPVRVPRRALEQSLRNLVKNAQQASAPGGEVRLRVARDGALHRFLVEDSGHGLSPEALARAGEPFFTTRPPGRGMGLGIFLARAVAERLGGAVELRARPDGGTTAELSFGEPAGGRAAELRA